MATTNPPQLLPWESTTLPPSQISTGWLPITALHPLSLALSLVLCVFLGATLGWPVALFGPVVARLMALDLTTHTLPDIYTLPLAAMGLAHAASTGQFGIIMGVTLMLLVAHLASRLLQRHLGGGDLKLLAAQFLWLGVPMGFFAIAIGCILWLPAAFWRPRHTQPFGVPLLLGWLAVLFL